MAAKYEVEIYSNDVLNVETVTFDNSSSEEFQLNTAQTVTAAKIFERMCFKLAKNKVKYDLLLEDLLKNVMELLQSDIGSISVKGNLIEKSELDKSNGLICVALSERRPGIIFSNNKSEEYGKIENINTCRHSTESKTSKSLNNMFGKACEENKIIISNDYGKDTRKTKLTLPKGHPAIKKIIIIPLKYKTQTIGVLSVANRDEDYSMTSFKIVMPLLGLCSKLLHRLTVYKEPLAMKIQKATTVSESKDKFLATISHELRTPLNGIVGMATLLPQAGPLTKKQELYVKNLTECSLELTSLLNNILDYSKMTADRLTLKKQTFFVDDAIADSVNIVKGMAISKSLKINVNIQKSIPPLMGDKQRLVQILMNIIGNACKFTEEGSVSINVTATSVPSKEEDSNKSIRNDSPVSSLKLPKKSYDPQEIGKTWNVLFEVKDTGVGIAYDEQDKIFDMFHQASNSKSSKQGTGLGLSISKELVRLMGGKISVSSGGLGFGSNFSFNVVLEEELDIEKLKTYYGDFLKGKKILIVDNHPETRLQLSDMLFKWGCIPQAVSSAEEAIQYLQFMPFGTAIVNICLPNMAGIELSRDIKESYPSMPFIGMGSFDVATTRNTLRNSSKIEYFDHYITKPIDQNALFPALVGCLMAKKSPKKPTDRENCRRLKNKASLKIIVAEDDAHNTFTIKEMLCTLGYTLENIRFVANGEECVNEVKISSPDVILMDIIMPVMDGITATTHIKKLKNPPFIIAVSAAVQPYDKARCQDAGIDGYVDKPIFMGKLDASLSPLIKKVKKSKSIKKSKSTRGSK